MYRRAAIILLLLDMIIIVSCFNTKGIAMNRYASTEAFRLQQEDEKNEKHFWGFLEGLSSGQRILKVNVMDKTAVVEYSEEDYDNLLRIVEAEAGCEDSTGKLLVANVIINRVKNEKFPDTITDVIYQQENGVTQFSPVGNGRIQKVKVSEETREAVEDAIAGEDVSRGALYFVARKYADSRRLAWFDNHLKRLFTYGGHEFFL